MARLIQYRTQASLYDGPFDAVVGWAAAGMGYIIVADDGRLIAIDGGHREDGEGFLQTLETCAGGRKPHIDLWIITHPHMDHYGAVMEISSNDSMRHRLRVDTVLYYFPDDFRDKNGAGCEEAIVHMEDVRAALGAAYAKPSVDEIRTAAGMKLHFLYTPTDCSILNNPNQLSLIFTVQGPKRKLMVTGDAFDRNLQIVVWRYPNRLGCDILQMPHHGLCDTGHEEFYKMVGAKTVLIPISRAGDRTMASDMYGNAPKVNRDAAAFADAVYKAFDGTVAIDM